MFTTNGTQIDDGFGEMLGIMDGCDVGHINVGSSTFVVVDHIGSPSWSANGKVPTSKP